MKPVVYKRSAAAKSKPWSSIVQSVFMRRGALSLSSSSLDGQVHALSDTLSNLSSFVSMVPSASKPLVPFKCPTTGTSKAGVSVVQPVFLRRGALSFTSNASKRCIQTTRRLYMSVKRVRFLPVLVTAIAKATYTLHDANETWYDDWDYAQFAKDSRRTVQIAQDLITKTGDWRGMDNAKHSLDGLELYLSPTIEQERAQRCRVHVQTILHRQDISRNAILVADDDNDRSTSE